jgi:hypothetical protein
VNSTCTVNPASVTLTSGVTATVAVTIATVADASAPNVKSDGARLFLAAVFLPFGLIALPWFGSRQSGPRRSRSAWLRLVLLLSIAAVPLGCGVSANLGKTTSPTGGNPVSTPSATYNPAVTATGPGVAETVQLTLIVE